MCGLLRGVLGNRVIFSSPGLHVLEERKDDILAIKDPVGIGVSDGLIGARDCLGKLGERVWLGAEGGGIRVYYSDSGRL